MFGPSKHMEISRIALVSNDSMMNGGYELLVLALLKIEKV